MNTETHKPQIKNILRGTEARRKLLAGVTTLTRAVKVTLGPKGRNVVLEKSYGAPLVTKDGVSVANEVDLEDRFEQMGARLVRGAASKTSDEAGDGTTTSTVLAGYLYSEGLKLVEAGVAPVALKRGMDKAVSYVVRAIGDMALPVKTSDQIAQVGTVSANGDTRVGKILAEAIEKVGRDGVIQVEEGRGLGLELETLEGLQWDRGPMTTEFLIKDGVEISLENAYIFVTDLAFNDPRLLMGMFQAVAEKAKPLIMICSDFTPQSVGFLWANFQKGSLMAVPIRAPGFGDRQTQYLQDIATVTGAKFITKEASMTFEGVTLEDLGTARNVTSTKTHTTITGGGGSKDDVMASVARIRAQIRTSSSEFDREKLQERMSKLLGGICTLRVGAHTELEMKELKARIEDALHATRSSVAEGIVPGGGTALLRAGDFVKYLYQSRDEKETPHELETTAYPEGEDETHGWNLVLRATEAPFREIMSNAGLRPDLLIQQVLDAEYQAVGIDARTGELADMFQEGIIDPARVVTQALINANSVASVMLTTDCLILPLEKSSDLG